MLVHYRITGGTLVFTKKAYALEMLAHTGPLRTLLGQYPPGPGPKMESAADGRHLSLIFSGLPVRHIASEDTAKACVEALKQRHGGDVRGQIAFEATYELFGQVQHLVLDLDTEDGEVRYER